MKQINNKNLNLNLNIKKFINNENITITIGILSLLIIFWLILYIVPNFFVSLFETFLGKIILILIVVLTMYKNYKYGIILATAIIILYRFLKISNKSVEGFTWSKDSTENFIKLQHSINPHIVFDTNKIQQQATQEEVDYFLKYGKWPWSKKVIELYKKAISENPYIRTDPKDQINQIRTIYNQASILKILSLQTKEGQFLLNGIRIHDISGNKLEDLPSGFGNFGYRSKLINKKNDIISCNIDENGNSKLVKTEFTGKDGITGVQTKTITNVDYKDLENMIPGFSFLKSPCNPCVAFNSPPNYTCPFKLDLKNSTSSTSKSKDPSQIWEYLWSTNSTPTYVEDEKNINPREFPILNQLKTELNYLNI